MSTFISGFFFFPRVQRFHSPAVNTTKETQVKKITRKELDVANAQPRSDHGPQGSGTKLPYPDTPLPEEDEDGNVLPLTDENGQPFRSLERLQSPRSPASPPSSPSPGISHFNPRNRSTP
jgi:hypothetical protein